VRSFDVRVEGTKGGGTVDGFAVGFLEGRFR
jgi:hypothetical protein